MRTIAKLVCLFTLAPFIAQASIDGDVGSNNFSFTSDLDPAYVVSQSAGSTAFTLAKSDNGTMALPVLNFVGFQVPPSPGRQINPAFSGTDPRVTVTGSDVVFQIGMSNWSTTLAGGQYALVFDASLTNTATGIDCNTATCDGVVQLVYDPADCDVQYWDSSFSISTGIEFSAGTGAGTVTACVWGRANPGTDQVFQGNAYFTRCTWDTSSGAISNCNQIGARREVPKAPIQRIRSHVSKR